MSDPFVGEIRMFGGNFAPAGWALCQGQLLPISENEVLFQLIGTTYGGDGETTFALPNLCGRVPVHQGTGPSGITYQLGEMGGVESVTLTTQQLASHNHPALGTSALANSTSPQDRLLAQADVDMYAGIGNTLQLDPQAVTAAGSSQPHDNMGPFLAVNFIISLYGIFPQPT